MHNLIIFGGSFDPIHTGHLALAKQVQNTFHFQQFLFVPSKQTFLGKKPSKASPEQRIHMIELAIRDYPSSYHFEIDCREIHRKTPSYSVISLRAYREEYGPATSITFLLGYDAFLQLPGWHYWKELFTLCHFLVVQRPGHSNQPLPHVLQTELQQRQTKNYADILTTPHGRVMYFNAGNYDISSSQIRAALASQQPLASNALPSNVRDYLLEKKLYLQ